MRDVFFLLDEIVDYIFLNLIIIDNMKWKDFYNFNFKIYIISWG